MEKVPHITAIYGVDTRFRPTLVMIEIPVYTHVKMAASNAAVSRVTLARQRSIAVSPAVFLSLQSTSMGSSSRALTTACACELTARSRGVSAVCVFVGVGVGGGGIVVYVGVGVGVGVHVSVYKW